MMRFATVAAWLGLALVIGSSFAIDRWRLINSNFWLYLAWLACCSASMIAIVIIDGRARASAGTPSPGSSERPVPPSVHPEE